MGIQWNIWNIWESIGNTMENIGIYGNNRMENMGIWEKYNGKYGIIYIHNVMRISWEYHGGMATLHSWG